MDWHPNRDAVEFFALQILPRLRRLRPEVRVVVAGRSGPEEFQRRFAGIPELRFTGTVPDMRVEIARAAVCVAPLRIGSGTRLKILEAAAMAKPMVSTTIGAEGLNFEDGREIVLADAPQPFAEAVARLLEDRAYGAALGAAARRKVETAYSFESLRSALRAALAPLEAAAVGLRK
jgi:glycosyltransferase involved in cell wall biosynthesis